MVAVDRRISRAHSALAVSTSSTQPSEFDGRRALERRADGRLPRECHLAVRQRRAARAAPRSGRDDVNQTGACGIYNLQLGIENWREFLIPNCTL